MKRFRTKYPTHHLITCESSNNSTGVDDRHIIPLPLLNVPRPPSELFVQGKPEALSLLSRLPTRALAIVGSRECQPRSLREIDQALASLRGFDLVIVSGLARGIDARAHMKALDVGLPTVAILGCGIEWSYPDENAPLRERILESGGLVISEFEPDAQAKPDHFIRRNRLIAGWSAATWVVEAGRRSGAINSASWAKQQDRYCFVTPCYPGDPTLEGNQRLLESREVIEGRTRPFWSTQSFGEVWLELESHLALFQPTAKKPRQSTPNEQMQLSQYFQSDLLQQIKKDSLQAGGVSIEELILWGKKQGVTPDQIYLELRAAIESGDVILRGSAIVAASL
jgi:DNA protecting protein DprA